MTEPEAPASDVAGQPTGQQGCPACRWFPLRADMMRQEAFARLSPFEKIVLLDINYRLAEHLSLVKCGIRHGPFAESDKRWAKRLSMSPETFQNARCKLGRPKDKRPKTPGLGWVIYTSGYRTRVGELRRTAYHDATFAEVARGVQSGAMYRRVWYDLIAALQKRELNHRDLVIAAFVCYFWKILGGREIGTVTIPKGKIRTMTGIPTATFKASLERLHKIRISSEGTSTNLFEFRDKHRYGFQISNWAGGPDVRIPGISSCSTTPGFIPLVAISDRGMKSEPDKPEIEEADGGILYSGGDRGSKNYSGASVDRCRATHTRPRNWVGGGD